MILYCLHMKIPCYSYQARAMKFVSWHFLNDGNTLILLWICLGLIAVLAGNIKSDITDNYCAIADTHDIACTYISKYTAIILIHNVMHVTCVLSTSDCNIHIWWWSGAPAWHDHGCWHYAHICTSWIAWCNTYRYYIIMHNNIIQLY